MKHSKNRNFNNFNNKNIKNLMNIMKRKQFIYTLILISLITLIVITLKKRKEFFCLIGCSKTTNQNTIDAITSMVNKSFTSNTQNCTSTINSNQLANFECHPTEDELNTATKLKADCLMAGKPADACAAISVCDFSNISQDAVIKFDMSCIQTDDLTNKMQQEVSNQLQQKMKKSEDALGKALTNLVGGKSDTENNTTIDNMSKNIVTKDFVTNLTASINTNQTITTKGQGQSVRNVKQSTVVNLIATAMGKNKTVTDLAQKVTDQAAQSQSITLKGLTDMVSSIFGSFTTMYIASAAICGIVVLGSAIASFASGGFNKVVNTGASLGSQAMNNPAIMTAVLK